MSGSFSILYMEDDPLTARIVQKKIENAGDYRVEVARDGTEGLKRCDEEGFDIVLVDKNMPGIDGLEVIRRLAGRDEPPSSVMLTASGNESAAVQAMKSGASDYLVKDPDGVYLDLLPAVLLQVLQQRRMEQEQRRHQEERERLIAELKEALASVKTLRGLLPICAGCKKIRDDEGYWSQIESYLQEHSEAEFSHGLCPDCAHELYGEYYDEPGADEILPRSPDGDAEGQSGDEG